MTKPPCRHCGEYKPPESFNRLNSAPARGCRDYLCRECNSQRKRDARRFAKPKDDPQQYQWGQVRSRAEVARELGVSKQAVEVIEAGAMAKLRAEAGRMGLKVDDFLRIDA